MGSSNPCSLHWERGVLTMGPLRKSCQYISFLWLLSIYCKWYCFFNYINNTKFKSKLCCCYCFSHSAMPHALGCHGLWPSGLLCPMDFPGKNTGMGCHFLLQRIFLTQVLNLHLHWQADSFFFLAGRFFTTELPGKPKVNF